MVRPHPFNGDQGKDPICRIGIDPAADGVHVVFGRIEVLLM